MASCLQSPAVLLPSKAPKTVVMERFIAGTWTKENLTTRRAAG